MILLFYNKIHIFFVISHLKTFLNFLLLLLNHRPFLFFLCYINIVGELMSVRVSRSYEKIFLIFMFFTFSIMGWVWEGIYDLLKHGVLANHGVLFGPWLPIYGAGCVLLLVVLKKYLKIFLFFNGVFHLVVISYFIHLCT